MSHHVTSVCPASWSLPMTKWAYYYPSVWRISSHFITINLAIVLVIFHTSTTPVVGLSQSRLPRAEGINNLCSWTCHNYTPSSTQGSPVCTKVAQFDCEQIPKGREYTRLSEASFSLGHCNRHHPHANRGLGLTTPSTKPEKISDIMVSS